MEFLYKIAKRNDKISLIVYDGDSLGCRNDVSDVFDTNTGIWWHVLAWAKD